MAFKEYYTFYNQLTGMDQSPVMLMNAFGHFICSHFQEITSGYIGFLEYGSYRVGKIDCHMDIPSDDSLSILNYSMKQMTYDVSKDMYSLSEIELLTENYSAAFPYINPLKLNVFIESQEVTSPVIVLRLFMGDFLIGDLIFLTELRTLSETMTETLSFFRHNLQALLVPLLTSETKNQIQAFLDMTDSLLNSRHYQTTDTGSFMARLLDIIFESTKEPDYGSALLYEEGYWTYIHTIGHDLDQLSSIKIPDSVFSPDMASSKNHVEVSPRIFITNNILSRDNTDSDPYRHHIFRVIEKGSKPIAQTIQLHIYLEGQLKGVLALDIGTSSDKVFTKTTIDVLKRIRLLGQVLFTYSNMVSRSESFEKLTTLISKLLIVEGTQMDFLKDFLKLLVENLYEVKYATAYLRDSKGIHFLEAIGHDLKGLQSLQLKPEYFVSDDIIKSHNILEEKSIQSNPNLSATLLSDLFSYAKASMPDDIYLSYTKVSQPIKDGLVAQMHLEKDMYMYITCDIPGGSPLSFSDDTIHLFSMLINLGFSFISNQYFIDKYKNLNLELENIIQQRTEALRKSNEKLRDLVERDSLTGLFNHNAIISRLTAALQKEVDVSIFLFDIDFFKKVNDEFGHQTGDMVLHKISEFLLEDLKVTAGRYGGEEFMLVMQDTDLPEAITYAQHILNRIEAYPFIKNRVITISGGVVTGKNTSGAKMIKTADTLLYEAKNAGRNQIKYNYCI